MEVVHGPNVIVTWEDEDGNAWGVQVGLVDGGVMVPARPEPSDNAYSGLSTPH